MPFIVGTIIFGLLNFRVGRAFLYTLITISILHMMFGIVDMTPNAQESQNGHLLPLMFGLWAMFWGLSKMLSTR